MNVLNLYQIFLQDSVSVGCFQAGYSMVQCNDDIFNEQMKSEQVKLTFGLPVLAFIPYMCKPYVESFYMTNELCLQYCTKQKFNYSATKS